MLCPKCKGIQDVIKVHEAENPAMPRLCDVECLKCGHIVYFQPYDFGSVMNLVVNNKKSE